MPKLCTGKKTHDGDKSMTYFFLLIAAIVFVSMAQVLFKIIANEHRDYLIGSVYDYRLYIALFVYTFSFLLWIVALSRIDYSIAIPLNVITVILGGVFGYFIFGQNISLLKIMSYSIISFGVLLLSYDSL